MPSHKKKIKVKRIHFQSKMSIFEHFSKFYSGPGDGDIFLKKIIFRENIYYEEF